MDLSNGGFWVVEQLEHPIQYIVDAKALGKKGLLWPRRTWTGAYVVLWNQSMKHSVEILGLCTCGSWKICNVVQCNNWAKI